MANGYDALCSGVTANDGMLVGIDSFTLCGCAVPGTKICINTEKIFEFGAVKIISGKVYAEDKLLAEGVIKVWEDLGSDTTD